MARDPSPTDPDPLALDQCPIHLTPLDGVDCAECDDSSGSLADDVTPDAPEEPRDPGRVTGDSGAGSGGVAWTRRPLAPLEPEWSQGDGAPIEAWSDVTGKWIEPGTQAHDIGATVCCLGHRHPLTVVAFDDQTEVYTLADEQDPSVQPFPVVHVWRPEDVKAYRWDRLLELSEYGLFSRRQLQNRAQYLDACAHLHDLGDHDTADELLNEAAIRWWKPCGVVGCEDGTYRHHVSELALLMAQDLVALEDDVDRLVRDRTVGTITVRSDAKMALTEMQGQCKACNGTGKVSRITDDHRLRLVEALIAAGLPERERPEPAATLNGAQVAAVSELVEHVSRGRMPRANAVVILGTVFGFSESDAAEVLDV